MKEAVTSTMTMTAMIFATILAAGIFSLVSIIRMGAHYQLAPRTLNHDSENPNGGVRKLVCKLTANKIPNQIGSCPIIISGGTINGIRITSISAKARKKTQYKYKRQAEHSGSCGTARHISQNSCNAILTTQTDKHQRKNS